MNKSIIFLITIIFYCCSEDKGNYDYNSINNIAINGIENSYTRLVGDTLNINIEVEFSLQENDNIEYSWEIEGVVVSKEKNLNIVTPAIFNYGTKNARLTVKDNDNNMEFFKRFTVEIVSPFNWGYYFLTENENKESSISYYGVIDNKEDKFISTNSIGHVELGKQPRSIIGKFSYITNLGYYWTITVLTKEGENPIIITDNATFYPNNIINSSNFADINAGYEFQPEWSIINAPGDIFYISKGQYISYVNGLLYRPAKHEKDYYWSHPVICWTRIPFAFVFDEITRKYFLIKPIENDPITGIFGDDYAYDDVLEIKDGPDFTNYHIIGGDHANSYEEVKIVAINESEINIHNFLYQDSVIHSVEATLNVLGGNEDSKALLVNSNDWYFSIGNTIYTSPFLLANLSEFTKIPDEFGKITSFQMSALKSVMVITTYDESSSQEYKGSVIFVDMFTREQTIHKNVIHKCVSILSCNSDGFGWGSYGDGK